jgi:hypothetical protein
MFSSQMFIIQYRLIRYITGGPISGCFDVLMPDVLIGFFPNYNFYNGSCPSQVGVMRTSAHEVRGFLVSEYNGFLPFYNIYKNNNVKG